MLKLASFKKIKALFLIFVFVVGATFTASAAGKHKILIVADDDGDYWKGIITFVQGVFKKKGFTVENTEHITLSLQGKLSLKAPRLKHVIKEIKRIKPDVVIMNTTLVEYVGLPLLGTGIPMITGGGMEMKKNGKLLLVDEDDNPLYNITGTYTMPRNHQLNSFKLLNKISPIGNKEAVFITIKSAAFTNVKITADLKKLGIKLKGYHEIFYLDDYKKLAKQYNRDKQVGWVLIGEIPTARRDGKSSSRNDFRDWQTKYSLKPSVSYWETMVIQGQLCALAIDSLTTVDQMTDMVIKILNGADYRTVKAENPKRSFIILNQKRAKTLGIRFPLEVLDSAWKVYTDYKGNYVGKKGKFN